MGEVQHVNISVDLSGLRNSLAASMRRTMHVVGAAWQQLDKLDHEQLALPVEMPFVIGPQPVTRDDVIRNTKEWLLSNGFRDAIEALVPPLEQANEVLLIWDLCSEFGSNPIPVELWHDRVVGRVRRFQRANFPDKLTTLTMLHRLPLDDVLRQHVERINAARNCLVHRRGVVSPLDLKGAANFEISWRHPALFLRDEDGERPLQIGMMAEKGGELGIRMVDVSRSFALGDTLTLSADEFQSVCWTLYIFVEDLISKMNELGLAKGMLRLPQAPASEVNDLP